MPDLHPCAAWAPDCQGKQDYDGHLLSISTRYWPGAGAGGSMVFDTVTGKFSSRPYGSSPSAKASIVLNHGKPDEYRYGDSTPWREQEFEADTEAQVKALVETWVQERFDEVRALLGMTPT